MFQHNLDFAKAHQHDLLIQVKKDRYAGKRISKKLGVRDRLFLYLGEGLISLGERIKQEGESVCACMEFSQGQP